jgi:HD-GYP domain-containing protein (c-di-GMP phosphodiesterase class II)
MNAYMATGLSRDQIASMMDDETYMSPQTAMKNGFATEILYDNQDQAQNSISNFAFSRLAIQNAANDSMKNLFEVIKKCADSDNPQNKEESEVAINTLDDLKKEKPELFNQLQSQIKNDAVTAERARITALDALDDPKNAALHEIIADAKANGKTAADIQNVVDIVKKHAPAEDKADPDVVDGQDFMKKAISDSQNSGADNVRGTGGKEAQDKQDDAAAINFMAGVINKKNGRQKNG